MGALLAVQPGPNYDESIYVAPAVHVLTSHGPPSITHSPLGWVHTGRRSWPLMVVPYAGAINTYLYLPAFALFGSSLLVSRTVHALLALLGIWGVTRLVGGWAGAAAGTAAGLALAIHPGYLSNTVLNNGGVAQWMGLMGCACLALDRYRARHTAAWAAALGLFCGAGVWARLNFAWFLAAAALGGLLAFGRRAWPPPRHAAALLAGALAGAAPLLWYQVRTQGRDTLAFMAGYAGQPHGFETVFRRVRLLLPSLVYDIYHRQFVWGGPVVLPWWQVAFAGAVLAAVLLLALPGRKDDPLRRWHRACAATIVALLGLMLWTRLPVREHHIVVLVPLVVACAVVAACRAPSLFAHARFVVMAVAAVYAALALSWDARAWRGMWRTGGVGAYSIVVMDVARYLDQRRPPRVAYFDWGYHNSIYTVTNGRVDARELFWYPVDSPQAPDWPREIVPGGIYVTHGPRYLHPIGQPASARFRQELDRSGLPYTRLRFEDAQGLTHTELVEVWPSR